MRVTTGLSEADIEIPGEGAGRPRGAAPRRLNTRGRRLPSLGAAWAGLRAEAAAQADRTFLWAPAAFALGSATYLGLKTEPPLWPLAALAVAALALAVAERRLSAPAWAAIAASALALVACGALGGKLRSDLSAAPIAPPHLGMVGVDGWVVDVAKPSATGARLLIAPTAIQGLAPERTPRLIRLVVPPEGVLGPGSAIRIRALVDPPPAPAAPGAYDFARDAWFQGIGGVGLSREAPSAIELAPPPWPLRLSMAVNAARWSLAQRLAADTAAVMGPNDAGAVGLVVTVATSHEDWLSDASRDDLRASGLAHMLAIAGLHTAAVSGFVFFALRLGVAAWPWLALRVNGKKFAAAGGLVAVGVYLALSGAHPPAVRAAITASVAFVAILADRRAISLRSLAIAALAILVVQPEDALQPGFQMSFCATAGLIALAEAWPRHHARPVGLPWPLAALQRLRDWMIAMVSISVVAGFATAPFSIQYFNRLPLYGPAANLSADFLAGMVMMPALAVGAALEAVGAGPVFTSPPLFIAGWGAKAIVSLAYLFGPGLGGALDLPSAPFPALAVSIFGVLLACLWRGRLRVIGLLLAMAVTLWPRPPAPVAWIASDGDDAAVVANGQVVALKPGKRAYAIQLWSQAHLRALPADPTVAQRALFDCNRSGCAPKAGAEPRLATWWSLKPPPADRLAALCANADIFVTRAPVVGRSCAAPTILGPDAFAAGGAADIYRDGRGWRIAWAQPLRGRRPWTGPSGSGE
jgi:competence protein ComEC